MGKKIESICYLIPCLPCLHNVKKASPWGEKTASGLSRERLMRGDKSALTQGIHSPYAPRPPIGREAALCNKFTPPQTQKTSPMSPPPSKSETNLRFVRGGDMGEVLGERGRFGGREPLFQEGALSLQGLSPRSFSKAFLQGLSPLTSSAPPVRGAFSSFLSCGVPCSESSCANGSTSA